MDELLRPFLFFASLPGFHPVFRSLFVMDLCAPFSLFFPGLQKDLSSTTAPLPFSHSAQCSLLGRILPRSCQTDPATVSRYNLPDFRRLLPDSVRSHPLHLAPVLQPDFPGVRLQTDCNGSLTHAALFFQAVPDNPHMPCGRRQNPAGRYPLRSTSSPVSV